MMEDENTGGELNEGQNTQNGNGYHPNDNNPKPKNPKPASIAWIAGLNFLIMVGYTVFSAYNGAGVFSEAFFIFFHVCVCTIISLSTRNWIWALTALAVLLIGFSTCVNILPKVKI